jgi:dihydrofolate synthase/folylpolyglutamate synthase
MTLQEWLDYQLRLHPQAIAMGLDRVRTVWQALQCPRPAPWVITAGGTNGKGSTVALLDAILRAAGYRVGTYTSPHLLRYNERVRVDGREVEDTELIEAFERIERARQDVPLTYFEFGTLAALIVLAQQQVDVAVLEVGLGGRLDAVNVIDADVAIVTTVDLDHQDYLGETRERIGHEKAGIFRAGRPAIIGERTPPTSVLAHADAIGADACLRQRDFGVVRSTSGWTWWHVDGTRHELPLPGLRTPVQVDNAATAVAALHALRARLPLAPAALAQGVAQAQILARMQRLRVRPDVYVDVAHNPQAALACADALARMPCAGRTLAVFSALRDKDIEHIVGALAPVVDAWFVGGLDRHSPRGLDTASLVARMPVRAAVHASVAQAYAAAVASAQPEDRVLVCGSFFTAAEVLAATAAFTS